jgi:SAM-dependent methyltransferase
MFRDLQREQDQRHFVKHSGLRYEDREALRSVLGHLRSARVASALRTAYWWSCREGWRFSPRRMFDHHFERDFDRRYCVDTAQRVDLDELGLPEETVRHGVFYQATSAALARRLIARLPVDHRDYAFVDLGCGKGRVLLIAGQFPFRAVIGVDVSEDLCRVARRNLASTSLAPLSPIELVCRSAAEYDIPHGNLVRFLFNPFDAVILREVAAKIAARLAEGGCDIWVLYHSPRCRPVLDAVEGLEIAAETHHTVVYHGTSPLARAAGPALAHAAE